MTSDLRNALLIHNPNAGNGGGRRRRMLDAARHVFAAGGIQSDLAETTGPGHATEIAQRAASEGRGLARLMKSSTALPPTKTGTAFLSRYFPAEPRTFSPKN